MKRVLSAYFAEFTQLNTVGIAAFVFCSRVISCLALSACKRNYDSGIGCHENPPVSLLNQCGDDAGAHSVAAFPNRKPKTFLHRNRLYQLR